MIGPDDHQLLASARDHEGLRLVVYDDATGMPLRPGDTLVGWPTIGYGTNLCIPITGSTALFILHDRMADAYTTASRYAYFDALSDNRQRVMVEMVYQLGAGSFSRFRRMHAALARHDYQAASQEMLDSKWAREDSPARAARLAQRMRAG